MWDLIRPVLFAAGPAALVSAAVGWLLGVVLPRQLAERYRLSVALVVGFFVGNWLLPDSTPLVPIKHWHWLPYLAAGAAAIGGLTLGGGVWWPERLVAYALLAVVTAWLLVPHWEELAPSRPYLIGLLAAYFTVLASLLAAMPARLLGATLAAPFTVSSIAVALLITMEVSMMYGQLAAMAPASLAGCLVATLLTRSVSEGPIPTRSVSEESSLLPLATALRGLIPVYAVLVGGLAFVGTIEPAPPLWPIMLAPAAPLMLWLFAASPLARLKGWPAVATQTAAVLVPLILLIVWVALLGE
jgi:hypothetical protein